MEPISPELALVDPVLARADLARATVRARSDAPVDPPALRLVAEAPVEVAARDKSEPRWLQTRVLPILLAISLAANGYLLATVVAGGRMDETASKPPAVTATAISAPASPTPVDASGSVEQRVLALVVKSPGGKLPPVLVDRKTGLAKNNLQAVCRSAASNSFLCVVRPARHRPGEGLYVRYRPSRDGRGSFQWYPYRSG